MTPLAYAKPSDCIDIVPSLAEPSEDSARLEAMLIQSLLDASRLLETDLVVPVNYFQKSTGTPTTKTIPRTGTQFVRLQPYVGEPLIYDEDNELISSDDYFLKDIYDPFNPVYYQLKWNGFKCGQRWWNYPVLKVTADWGYPCIPPDVTLAVKNMGALMFLNNPMANIGEDSSLTDNQEQRLRTTYNRVMSAWSDKLHHLRNLGVG